MTIRRHTLLTSLILCCLLYGAPAYCTAPRSRYSVTVHDTELRSPSSATLFINMMLRLSNKATFYHAVPSHLTVLLFYHIRPSHLMYVSRCTNVVKCYRSFMFEHPFSHSMHYITFPRLSVNAVIDLCVYCHLQYRLQSTAGVKKSAFISDVLTSLAAICPSQRSAARDGDVSRHVHGIDDFQQSILWPV